MKVNKSKKRAHNVKCHPKPNDSIPHPETGKLSFGVVPQAKSGPDTIPEGDIQLRYGKHNGPNSGFGAAHIWVEHRKEMEQAGFTSKKDVPAYVALIVRAGSAIYYEGGYNRHKRVAVVRSSRGTAILELKDMHQGIIWSIVTAYSGQNVNGTRVGAVR